jgi:hypothetical protein
MARVSRPVANIGWFNWLWFGTRDRVWLLLWWLWLMLRSQQGCYTKLQSVQGSCSRPVAKRGLV